MEKKFKNLIRVKSFFFHNLKNYFGKNFSDKYPKFYVIPENEHFLKSSVTFNIYPPPFPLKYPVRFFFFNRLCAKL